jgi:WD40 repeat protein
MSGLHVYLQLVVCVLTVTQLADAEPPDQTPPASRKQAQTDRYGDPLPEGAVARLGTQRLTLAGAVYLTFSSDGRRLAAHDGSHNLRVWEVASGKEIVRITTPRSNVRGPSMSPIAFSPDGETIAFGCPEDRDDRRQRDPAKRARTVRIWDVATGKELRRLSGELKGLITQVFFSPDGRGLFACGYDTPVHYWDLVGGGPPRTIGDFQSTAFLALSRDGKIVTAVSAQAGDWRKRMSGRRSS